MKRAALFISGLFISLNSFAQEAQTKTFWDDPINDPSLPYYIVITFIGIVIVLAGTIVTYLVKVLNMFTVQAEKEKARKLGIAYKPKESLWSKFTQRMNASVPVSQEKDIELDHNFDGIKELDNHLPPWWKWLFYGTIAWSAVYIVAFHFSNTLPLSLEEYEQELTVAAEQARQYQASQPQAVIDESKLEFTNDPVLVEKGKSVFMNNSCGSCHRNDGGGNTIGPNLTDTYWLNGGDIKSVFSTIKNGKVEKGMPAWGKSMSPQDVRDVTFFVMSLQGTNPANAKAAQGELFQPVISDSTKVRASL